MAVQVGDGLSAALEGKIRDGTIPHGERLPAERQLALELGVSRTSLRDALRELELKGLIDRRPGRGTTVLDPRQAEVGRSLLSKLKRPERDIQEIMDLRAVIEPGITARAARRATPRDIRELHHLVEEMGSAGVSAAADLDVAFHSQIARASQNPLLMHLVELASQWIDQSRREYGFTEQRLKRSIAAHGRIAAAIDARDPDRAEQAMAAHIESVNRYFTETSE